MIQEQQQQTNQWSTKKTTTTTTTFVSLSMDAHNNPIFYNGQQKYNDRDNNLFYLNHWTATHQVQRQQ